MSTTIKTAEAGGPAHRRGRAGGPRSQDAVWRATVDQRLEGVEDAIGDLRTRVNSVLALIGAAVAGQIALRFFGH